MSTSTPAAAALARAGVPFRLHEHPPARTEAELHLTGLDVATSAKTLAFALPDGRFALAAIPGRARLRYGNLARALGVPRSALRPMGPEELRELGMEPGGVSPACDDSRVVRVVDSSLLAHPVVYCGSGSPSVSVEVAPADLVTLAPTALVTDLCSDAP
ncbi:MAG: YbaK/EbsC family protein [Propionicimonas sp.]|uniref:aminoacyl-tRNA deacylase n=1 Tax=Propionicimonas sp. TaxID=1955623 RepID=UPI003D1249E3